MDLTQLRAFITVAREGNLTRAAAQLHLTQPAVSLQIKALQQSLNLVLFTRTPTGMMLTADGAKLLPLAERVLASSRELEQAAHSLNSTLSGKLSIGTILDPEFTRLGGFLKGLVEAYPQVSTELQHGMSGWVQQRIRHGELDVGYYLDEPLPQMHVLPLRNFTYQVLAPAGWEKRVIGKSWSQLAQLPWIWSPPESVHHRLLSKVFGEHGAEPLRVALVDQEASMLDLVKSGVGLSLVRDSIALRESQAHGLVMADSVSLTTQLSFICLSNRRAEPAISTAFQLMDNVWHR
jgi:DNA-binding transcriptional LysR family regulator